MEEMEKGEEWKEEMEEGEGKEKGRKERRDEKRRREGRKGGRRREGEGKGRKERREEGGGNLLLRDLDSTLQPAGEHSLSPPPSKDLCLQHRLTNTWSI